MYVSSKQEETIRGVYLGKDVSILDEQILQTAEAMPARYLVYEITCHGGFDLRLCFEELHKHRKFNYCAK